MKCKLVHRSEDRSKDLIVRAFPDWDLKKVEWSAVKVDGSLVRMPPVIVIALEEFKFYDKTRHTFQCLTMAINLARDFHSSLRS